MNADKNNIRQYEGFRATNHVLNQGCFDEISAFEFEPFEELKSLPSISEKLVFGKKIERFFSAYIQESLRYDLLAENIQVISDKVTIGELDFIVKDHLNDEVLHVELVYKFYLMLGSHDNIGAWVGPNKNDSLVLKLDKLKSKQFPLLYKQSTRDKLKQLGVYNKGIKQQCCFLANLFLPYHLLETTITAVNNVCVVGWWASLPEFCRLDYKRFKFGIPDKKDWMIGPGYGLDWVGYDSFLEGVQKMHRLKKSPLCWVDKGDGNFERFFLVWW